MKFIVKLVLLFIFALITFTICMSVANADTVVYRIEQKPSWTCNTIMSNSRINFIQCENDYILCIVYPGINVSCVRK